jgi:hypothetical protein
MHQTESAKYLRNLQTAPELLALSTEFASRRPSGAQNVAASTSRKSVVTY